MLIALQQFSIMHRCCSICAELWWLEHALTNKSLVLSVLMLTIPSDIKVNILKYYLPYVYCPGSPTTGFTKFPDGEFLLAMLVWLCSGRIALNCTCCTVVLSVRERAKLFFTPDWNLFWRHSYFGSCFHFLCTYVRAQACCVHNLHTLRQSPVVPTLSPLVIA